MVMVLETMVMIGVGVMVVAIDVDMMVVFRILEENDAKVEVVNFTENEEENVMAVKWNQRLSCREKQIKFETSHLHPWHFTPASSLWLQV